MNRLPTGGPVPERVLGSFSGTINPRTFRINQKFKLELHQFVISVRSKAQTNEQIAMRLRVGHVGHSQWLNELKVYLLPNFKNYNVLPFLGCDKNSFSLADGDTFNSHDLLRDMNHVPYESGDRATEHHLCPEDEYRLHQTKIRTDRSKHPTVDYWILNDYTGCITLRHYLTMHTISWGQMLKIARGIMGGLNYLHEYVDYHYDDETRTQVAEEFIRSSNGALQKVTFQDSGFRIEMTPPFHIAIIHRNLSSLNIVLRPDTTPCIWNFGSAFVHHAFVPINSRYLVDRPIKDALMVSPYSAPEVLGEHGALTLSAMKSIDMYATGIILWELMSRCVLPNLIGATQAEELERSDPEPYYEPFEREFRCLNRDINPRMLKHAVKHLQCRPATNGCWFAGKKTHRFVQTIRELWDQDSEARLNSSSALERLDRFSLRDVDKRYRHRVVRERVFDMATSWPPETPDSSGPVSPSRKFKSTLVVEKLSQRAGPSYRADPDSQSTTSSSASLMGGT